MVIRKWNENKKDYDVVTIPDAWNAPLHCDSMAEIVNCVNCGCEMRYGDGFKSKRYRNVAGMSYSECKKCFDEYLPTYFNSRRSKDGKSKSDKQEAVSAEMAPIIREFMNKVSEVALKHDAKAAPLIRSAACIIIAESDRLEDKADKVAKLLKQKDSLEDLIKILEEITGDTND